MNARYLAAAVLLWMAGSSAVIAGPIIGRNDVPSPTSSPRTAGLPQSCLATRADSTRMNGAPAELQLASAAEPARGAAPFNQHLSPAGHAPSTERLRRYLSANFP